MGLGWACFYSGQFEKSLEYFDKAIRLSPHDPGMGTWLDSKSAAHFALKQYDQAVEWARRAVVIDPSFGADLVAPLALSGHETEARDNDTAVILFTRQVQAASLPVAPIPFRPLQ